jgi:hypothetical protein
VVIRDYAYASSHPMHRGIPPISPIIEPTRPTSEVSLSSSEFTGRQAKALFDFEPESESECALRTGDIIWVQYRQCQVSSRRAAGRNAVTVARAALGQVKTHGRIHCPNRAKNHLYA